MLRNPPPNDEEGVNFGGQAVPKNRFTEMGTPLRGGRPPMTRDFADPGSFCFGCDLAVRRRSAHGNRSGPTPPRPSKRSP